MVRSLPESLDSPLSELWDCESCHETRGTRNQKWLFWPGPAAIYPTERLDDLINKPLPSNDLRGAPLTALFRLSGVMSYVKYTYVYTVLWWPAPLAPLFQFRGVRGALQTERKVISSASYFFFQNMEISVTLNCVFSEITRYIIMTFLANRSYLPSILSLITVGLLTYSLTHSLALPEHWPASRQVPLLLSFTA